MVDAPALAEVLGVVAASAKEEMTNKCLMSSAVIAVKIAKSLLDLPETNPSIAVSVLKKWEIEVKGDLLIKKDLAQGMARAINIKPN